MRSLSALKKIRKPYITGADARKAGVSPQMLTYLVKRGVIERRAQGIYAFPEKVPIDLEGLIKEKLMSTPQGVIGLRTALQLHDLTDDPPGDIDIIVPNNNVPKKKLTGVRLHRVRADFSKLRRKKLRGIPVTTVEQTLVDLLRTKVPLSTLLDIFHRAQQKRLRPSISEITAIAADFHIRARAKTLVEALW